MKVGNEDVQDDRLLARVESASDQALGRLALPAVPGLFVSFLPVRPPLPFSQEKAEALSKSYSVPPIPFLNSIHSWDLPEKSTSATTQIRAERVLFVNGTSIEAFQKLPIRAFVTLVTHTREGTCPARASVARRNGPRPAWFLIAFGRFDEEKEGSFEKMI